MTLLHAASLGSQLLRRSKGCRQFCLRTARKRQSDVHSIHAQTGLFRGLQKMLSAPCFEEEGGGGMYIGGSEITDEELLERVRSISMVCVLRDERGQTEEQKGKTEVMDECDGYSVRIGKKTTSARGHMGRGKSGHARTRSFSILYPPSLFSSVSFCRHI